MHRSFRQPAGSPHKPGAVILERGEPVRRPARQEPQCELCPKRRHLWTPSNRATYRRWRFWLRGFPVGELTPRDAWDFYRLDEAARELEGAFLRQNINEAIVRSFK